jgi:hypothetical protein
MMGQARFMCKHKVYNQQKEWEEARRLILPRLRALLKPTSLLSYHTDKLFCYSHSMFGILWTN